MTILRYSLRLAAICAGLLLPAVACAQQAAVIPAPVTTPVSAAPVPTPAVNLPPELMQEGQPIDPVCFEEVSADEWVDITTCQKAEIVKMPIEATDLEGNKIGYRYGYKNDTSDTISYSYYQFIGKWNGSPVVLSYSSGGGTGQFTSLVSIERNAGKVRVLQGFGAGDRCNGGIVDAKIDYGTLRYGQNMTPIDFLQLAENNPHDLQPYEDLEASASSCFGIARYEDEKFIGVSLLPLPQGQVGDNPVYKYQDCFNRLYSAELAKGKKELNPEELKQFTGEFNQVCLQNDQPR